MIEQIWVASKGVRSDLIVDQFIDSPAGAYLSQQDNELIKRLRAELDRESSRRRTEVENRVDNLSLSSDNKEAPTFDRASSFFSRMPILISMINQTHASDLSSFSNAVYEKMKMAGAPPLLLESLFLRKPDFRSQYDQHKEVIFAAITPSAAQFAKERPKVFGRDAQYDYEMFLFSEAAYGLENFVNVRLQRFGLYEALGTQRHTSFQEKLRGALRKTYETLHK
ncbi:MAG: hypothetical protein NTV56_00695 [Alphaproteobacteria bacterium]|nr:hypothetical protein [Alphaproteobacteria bacterium]